jgi:hypothetical protein
MIYTYQLTSESGSFGAAEGTDVSYATSKKDLIRALEDWCDQHEQVGSDASYASLTVWRGRLANVQDQYPDLRVIPGPRGGARFEQC